MELEEYYLDWFFMSKFGKDGSYWRALTEEGIMTAITLENLEDKRYWENMQRIMGGKQ